MEQNNSEVLPVQPVQPVQPVKSNNFLVILLSVLLLLSVSIAGFFALQTQKLTKQLAQLQSATPFPSPTATLDPTADWKIYTNTEYGFTFKYPQDFSLTITSPDDQGASFPPNSYKDLDFQNLPLVSFEVFTDAKNTPLEFINSLQKPGFSDIQNIETKTLGSYSVIQFNSRNLQSGSGGLDLNTVIQLSKTGFLMITLQNSEKGMVDTYSQILSTFHFLK